MSKAEDAQLDAQTALVPNSRPGNQSAVKEGFYTRDRYALKLRARAVRRMVNNAYRICHWLTATDRPTVQGWAETVKLKAIAFVALEKQGIYRLQGDDLVGRRMLDEYRRLAQLELAYAKELGFTPASRAAMRIDVLQGDDLAAKAARLRNGTE